jgi:hypothetical protein
VEWHLDRLPAGQSCGFIVYWPATRILLRQECGSAGQQDDRQPEYAFHNCHNLMALS